MRHIVAVIGGATAGAEVAGRLAERGVTVVVFERHSRPYGKIEDGLPRWHIDLRRKERESIDKKLDQPGVHLVPLTGLGRDIDLEEIVLNWGISAVVLACGAWRDRPLPVADEAKYRNHGLIYQNPFIASYNHLGEAAYQGPRYELEDNAIVVGGGLASIDVVKVLMLETTRTALHRLGIEVGLLEIETRGIPRTLEEHHLRWEDLGLQGCTLLFWRGPKDLTLVPLDPNASSKRTAQVETIRIRSMEKAMEKYCFQFRPYTVVDGLEILNDRVAGVRLRRTRFERDRLILTNDKWTKSCSYIVSSIGSIPEPISGLPMEGEFYAFSDRRFGRFSKFPNLFSVGNVVTGLGNIVASRKHARNVSEEAIERYLGIAENTSGSALAAVQARSDLNTAKMVTAFLTTAPGLSPEKYQSILNRTKERQASVGYPGNYRAWIRQTDTPT